VYACSATLVNLESELEGEWLVRHNPVMQAAPEIANSPAAPAAGRRPRARRGEGDRLRTEIVEAASAMLAE